ncbi:hypothetical protein ABZP36_012840 [Zizania latifolia]
MPPSVMVMRVFGEWPWCGLPSWHPNHLSSSWPEFYSLSTSFFFIGSYCRIPCVLVVQPRALVVLWIPIELQFWCGGGGGSQPDSHPSIPPSPSPPSPSSSGD